MDAVRQRNQMGSGKVAMGGETFGVKPLAEANSNGKSMGSADAKMLSESQRTAPVKNSGKMANQSNPDHGRHS